MDDPAGWIGPQIDSRATEREDYHPDQLAQIHDKNLAEQRLRRLGLLHETTPVPPLDADDARAEEV